ncbi:MAG: sodium-dependent transporter [Muribaculaceae bacterium]|nr:sodium-dependent transporter [Muribaculaceae bacterium]
MSSSKATFSSKIGLIAATVGSAVGLGNVWRFPAETQTNGGAAFLFVYILCLLILGVPVMLAEFSLGRGTGSDAVGAFTKLRPNTPWWLTGALAVLASYLILCFYMVVAGWTFEYLWQSITGNLYNVSGSIESLDASFHQKMENYICEDISPLINLYVLIAINIGILLCGVQKGIERLSNILMPLLFILLLVFCGVSLSLPDAGTGLKFFLTPDFSKITPGVIINALGQAFFSLSLGMGILITYSSYFPKDTKLTKTAITVSLLDLLVAIMMGIIIFPAVSSFGLDGAQLRGTTLVFVTLPEIFAQMQFTQLWSLLFFLLLFVAALTSTISIAEVSVAWIQHRFNKKRWSATLIVMMPLFIFSTLCSLSFGSLSNFKIFGLTIFDFLDNLATNIFLPIVSILVCIFIGWALNKSYLKNEITNSGSLHVQLYPVIQFIIKYLAPPLILLILVSYFIEF